MKSRHLLVFLVPIFAMARQLPSSDDLYWSSIKDKNAPELWEDYVQKFPHGTYVKIACYELRKVRGAAALPSPCSPSPARSEPVSAVPAASTAPATIAPATGAMELLREVQQAMGGAQRLAEVRDFRRTMKIEAKGPLGGKGNNILTWCASGAFLEVNGKARRYFDGNSSGWIYTGGFIRPIGLVNARQNDFLQWFHLLLADTRLGEKVTLAGPNKLQMEDGNGDLGILEINPDTHLPVSLGSSLLGTPIAYSDWRDVQGFKLPFRASLSVPEMPKAEATLTWQLNTGIDCASLAQKPLGAKEVKLPPKALQSTTEDPVPVFAGDTTAQADEFLKRIQQKMGGTEALLQVRDFQRRYTQSQPMPDGKMSKGREFMETGCITGELRQISPTQRTDIFFDGKQSAWVKNPRGVGMLPSDFALELQRVQFDYDVFNVALSDRLPGRERSLLNDQTIRITDELGSQATVTIDPTTGLPVRKVSRFVGKDQVPSPVEEYFSDWKPVNGILLPHHLVGKRNGVTIREVQIQEWKLNTGVKCSDLARPNQRLTR